MGCVGIHLVADFARMGGVNPKAQHGRAIAHLGMQTARLRLRLVGTRSSGSRERTMGL